MHFEIQHPGFQTRRLSLEMAEGLFRAPILLVDGNRATSARGKYIVASDAGVETTITLKNSFPDPIPKVKIGDDVVALADALRWYETAWVVLPFALVAAGGAIGGLCGGIAVAVNGRIFRDDYGTLAKYGLSGLVTIGAAFAWLALALVLQSVLGAPHR
jgi:hypothetical protein